MAAGSGRDLFFFLVFTLIWGPPKIILPKAPLSVRPGLIVIITFSLLLIVKSFCYVNLSNKQDSQAFAFCSCMIIIAQQKIKAKIS